MTSVVACVEKPMNRPRPSFCICRAAARQPFFRSDQSSNSRLLMPCSDKQIHVVQLQVIHRGLESLEEFLRRGAGRDLGLDDHLVARQFGQDVAELHFRGAVAARGFDVVDAQFERAMDGRFEVCLVVARDVPRRTSCHLYW